MDNNIRKVEEYLAILNKRVDDIESEIDNLELKLAIIKEMQKDEKLKASAEVEGELKKVVERLHSLITVSGICDVKEFE